jgi:hypothetical protein
LLSKLKIAHTALSSLGKGCFQGDDDKPYASFAPIFRDIPVLKEIPPTFRLKLSNCFEALTFGVLDTISEMSEKTHLYILMHGEALIISSQKQYEQFKDYNR